MTTQTPVPVAAPPYTPVPREERQAHWAQMLEQALHEPGVLHDGYTAFWNYSIGNQMLALAQCLQRGITPGPLAAGGTWKQRGRLITKAEKGADPKSRKVAFVHFAYKAFWFVYAQTHGADWEAPPLPDWDRTRAMEHLHVTLQPFDHFNGNTQGYSLPEQRILALNPLAVYPHKTTFHELGHILLGHGHSSDLDHASKEVQAELVAYLCGTILNLEPDALSSSRAYIQSYIQRGGLVDTDARQVFSIANQILEAGYPAGWKQRLQEEPDEHPAR
jgi:hypothetical protein